MSSTVSAPHPIPAAANARECSRITRSGSSVPTRKNTAFCINAFPVHTHPWQKSSYSSGISSTAVIRTAREVRGGSRRSQKYTTAVSRNSVCRYQT